MVAINTNNNQPSLEVRHLIDIQNANSTIVTTQDTVSKRCKIFLIFGNNVYRRNGLRESWEKELSFSLCEYIKAALKNTQLPRYSTNSIALNILS